MRRQLALPAARADAALALLAWSVGMAEAQLAGVTESPVLVGVGLASIMTWLAFRRRIPVPALAGFVVGCAGYSVLLHDVTDLSTVLVALLFMPYPVGARETGNRALTGLAIGLVGVVAVDLITQQLLISDFLFPGGMVTASWFAGRIVRQRTLLAAELHEQAARGQERREEEARNAVAAERRRIAREMHDVVAHGVSVMVVQAGGARRILDADPERALAAATQIERTGREALAEMRRLLGILRPDEAEIELAPSPSLGQLDDLVRRARDAGLRVSLDVRGEPRPVPIGLDLTSYRIVQEGLTNALKHAGSVVTHVSVTWGPESLELCVADEGPGPGSRHARRDGGHGGHGLVGMRERVKLYGGELEAGPQPRGGFRVRARLPLEPALEPSRPAEVVPS